MSNEDTYNGHRECKKGKTLFYIHPLSSRQLPVRVSATHIGSITMVLKNIVLEKAIVELESVVVRRIDRCQISS